MTETAGAGEAKRLDELAAVTAEYATYSSVRGGLAFGAAGAWYVATFAIALRSETWGRIAGLWTPAVVLGVLWAGKRYYQRLGTVELSTPAQKRSGRKVWLVALAMMVVISAGLRKSHGWSSDSEQLARFAIVFALMTAPLVPLLVERIVFGLMDGAVAYLGISNAFMVASIGGDGTRAGWIVTQVLLGWLALFGLLLIVEGIVEHRQYGRLERRLAALRSSAA